ncbi:unnamed protein product [Protopolystoma xenopodis]|uniref:Uncharacterized protein n=1 Tax=Protopolystoma xenopodis TaxID=117903 RepID=A0A448X6F6_9PLAT|nr:unnamed protein product [Protopolystoma xenopodis]
MRNARRGQPAVSLEPLKDQNHNVSLLARDIVELDMPQDKEAAIIFVLEYTIENGGSWPKKNVSRAVV